MIAPYLVDARQVTEAEDLIASHGARAAHEAAARAGRSRDLGNHVHFCRWRQTERLIDLMASRGAIGTVH